MSIQDQGRYINLFSGVALAFVTIVISFAQYKIFYSFLSESLIGFWLLLVSVGAFLTLLDLGLAPTLGREIAFKLSTRDLEKSVDIANLIATARLIYFCISVLILLLGVVGYLYVDKLDATKITTYVLFILGVYIQITTVANNAILFGFGKIVQERIVKASALIINLAITFLLLQLEFGLVSLGMGWCAGNAFARILSMYLVRKPLKEIPRTSHYIRDQSIFLDNLRLLFLPSVKWAVTALGAVLIFKSDAFLIAYTASVAEVARYESVLRMIMAIQTIAFLAVSSSTTAYSRMHKEGNTAGIRELLFFNLRTITILVSGPIAFLAFFGGDVVTVWLGPDAFIGYPVIWLLLVLLILEVHHVTHAVAVMATGRIIFYKPAIIAGGLNVILSLIFALKLGLLGVALGTVVAQLVTNNWYAPYKSAKFFEISWKEYTRLFSPVLKIYCVLGVIAFYLASDFFHNTFEFDFFIVGLIYFILYIVCLAFIFDLKDVRSMLFSRNVGENQ